MCRVVSRFLPKAKNKLKFTTRFSVYVVCVSKIVYRSVHGMQLFRRHPKKGNRYGEGRVRVQFHSALCGSGSKKERTRKKL